MAIARIMNFCCLAILLALSSSQEALCRHTHTKEPQHVSSKQRQQKDDFIITPPPQEATTPPTTTTSDRTTAITITTDTIPTSTSTKFDSSFVITVPPTTTTTTTTPISKGNQSVCHTNLLTVNKVAEAPPNDSTLTLHLAVGDGSGYWYTYEHGLFAYGENRQYIRQYYRAKELRKEAVHNAAPFWTEYGFSAVGQHAYASWPFWFDADGGVWRFGEGVVIEHKQDGRMRSNHYIRVGPLGKDKIVFVLPDGTNKVRTWLAPRSTGIPSHHSMSLLTTYAASNFHQPTTHDNLIVLLYESWTPTDFFDNPLNSKLVLEAFDEDGRRAKDAQVIGNYYVIGGAAFGYSHIYTLVWWTDDGGRQSQIMKLGWWGNTFQSDVIALPAEAKHTANSMIVCPGIDDESDHILVSTDKHVYYSIDSGVAWFEAVLPFDGFDSAAFDKENHILYFARGKKTFASTFDKLPNEPPVFEAANNI